MTDRIEKVRARITQTARLYIHNDLSMAALHFKDNIDAKESGEDGRGGKTYEYIACAVMLAFTFEAKINFLGWKLIQGWKEFQPFHDKVDQVFEKLGLELDWGKRPYSSILAMKRFRDEIALWARIAHNSQPSQRTRRRLCKRRISMPSPTAATSAAGRFWRARRQASQSRCQSQ